jgi:hypothetical protein
MHACTSAVISEGPNAHAAGRLVRPSAALLPLQVLFGPEMDECVEALAAWLARVQQGQGGAAAQAAPVAVTDVHVTA